MRFLSAACFIATLFVLIAKHGAESGACGETDVCTAIKTLAAKLEKLIALVTPPGKLEDLELTDLLRSFLFRFFLYRALHPSLIFFSAVPASSCKELYDKHR